MDIAILGDVSRSMRKTHRETLIQLINDMVDEFGISPDENHFALGTFGRTGTIVFKFNDKKYHDPATLKNVVKEEISRKPKLFGTRIDIAMDKAVTELFTPEGGDRPEAKNLLIVITDGKPKKSKADKVRRIPFEKTTEELEVTEVLFNLT